MASWSSEDGRIAVVVHGRSEECSKHLTFLEEMEEIPPMIDYRNAVHANLLYNSEEGEHEARIEDFYRRFMQVDVWLREFEMGKPGAKFANFIIDVMREGGYPGMECTDDCTSSLWFMDGDARWDIEIPVRPQTSEYVGPDEACECMICFPSSHPYPKLTVYRPRYEREEEEVCGKQAEEIGVDHRVFTPILFPSSHYWKWERATEGKWRFMIVCLAKKYTA